MPEGQVLEFSGMTKRFGAVTAVSDFSARVDPGLVTGFLGPNGAGKTTSLRILLGLVRPTSGDATIGGAHYARLANPLQTVGAVLEASSFHPGRTAAAHLTVYAQAAKIPRSRVDEVLGLVGLADAAGRKVGGYSLGMRQRLGLAYALLGDPGVLVLDEPTNGLDPEGIKWIRGFLRQLAREGRTVLVSSHLLTEVQQTVDALLIISRGRLVFQGGLDELVDPSEQATVVDSPDRAALAEALRASQIPFEVLRSGLTVRGIEPTAVGLAAAAAGVPLSSLQKRGPALEEVFLDLVNGTRLHASAAGGPGDVIPALESGPITVLASEETVPDASAEASPEEAAAGGGGAVEAAGAVLAADEPAGGPDEPDEPAVGPDEPAVGLPSAAPDGAAWIAAETDAELPDEQHVDDPGAPSHPHTASFAVASTGVIDIIPGTEAGDDDESPDAGEADGEEPDSGGADSGGADAGAEPAAAESVPVQTDDDLTDEDLYAPETDDRPWENYVKTEADLEADRFFAAFDAEKAAAAAAEAEAEADADADADADATADAEPTDAQP
ncbi:ABC transporter ATP-binding protein, partial [Microbacterium sp. HJ5]